jgi:alpha-ketoglutarate-dependent taurine dioxygenase
MKKLLQEGWLELLTNEPEDILSIALQLGRPIQSRRNTSLVDRLTVTRQEEAYPRSLSAIYGVDAFPFHTDSAYLHIPPQFMLLRLAEGSKSDRPTLLHDVHSLSFTEEEKRVILRDVWLVNGGRGRFLTTLLNNTLVPGSTIFRYDRCCMRPAHPTFNKSSLILDSRCNELTPITINWTNGLILILDNWRMLHARGQGSIEDNKQRVLERVLVATEKGRSCNELDT